MKIEVLHHNWTTTDILLENENQKKIILPVIKSWYEDGKIMGWELVR